MGTRAHTQAVCLVILIMTVLARPDARACVHEELDWAEGVHGSYVISVDADYTGQCAAVDVAWVHVKGTATPGLFRDPISGHEMIDPVTIRVWVSGEVSGDWIQATWSTEVAGPFDTWMPLQSLAGPTPADLLVAQPVRVGVALNDMAMADYEVAVEPVVDLTLVGLHAGAPVAAESKSWGELKARFR